MTDDSSASSPCEDLYDDPYYVPPGYIENGESDRLTRGRHAVRRMTGLMALGGICWILIVTSRVGGFDEEVLLALLIVMVALGLIAGIWAGRRLARIGLVVLCAGMIVLHIGELLTIPRLFLLGEPVWALVQTGALGGFAVTGLLAAFSSAVGELIDYRRAYRDLGEEPPE